MAAKNFASRLRKSPHFLGGFVAGAVVGATGAGLTALQFFRSQSAKAALAVREPDGSAEKALLEQYGFPLTGTATRCYTNHALSYDQAKRVPTWVLEHISKSKIMGDADRRHCKFKPDPNIPPTFSAFNEDYVGSGWSRGHMAPAGNNKFSTKAMAETFYLSNIVPQNFDNNSGYWNRIEMYCRELTERFEDVWIVSGPLTLPQTGDDGKKTVSYQLVMAHYMISEATTGMCGLKSPGLRGRKTAEQVSQEVRWTVPAPILTKERIPKISGHRARRPSCADCLQGKGLRLLEPAVTPRI
ncbi:nuclease EXOG, mitochondrial isoform X2 [Choloepus didactylus]|uniref:nuclease EXOG, mitochondrial isoform X2 n=1 Tax=Choloepus didactylus TaxID=27675 RepID=UPI00189F5F5D|nr:nuclease EXOG, mitochondrial isoform X2 [Choloepus didactylus]XP_037703406.1 nuclease EXOG, mitochondrial isoform X2 [Choloepus didactylus]